MSGSDAGSPQVELAHPTEDVYRATDALLDHFERNDTPVSLGVFALVVALGRVLGPDDLSGEDEQAFVKNVLDFITAHFATGPVN